MPIIRVSKPDIERLVGRELGDQLEILLPRIKCEVEYVSDEGIIEYEATHDRPDLFSAEGLSRSLRGLLGLRMHKYSFHEEKYRAYASKIDRRPYVAFAIVKNLELDDEGLRQIMQLQEKLATVYGRHRRKASIGVYDLDKIKMPVYYELRDPVSTRFIPLEEDKQMSLNEVLVETEKGRKYGYILRGWEKYPVLRDKTGRILSMPPIINSDDTKVTVETRNVLIDSTGTDLETVIDMVTIMATSIAERSRDGHISLVETIYPNRRVRSPREHGRRLKVEVKDVSRILGIDIDAGRAAEILLKMGYSILEKREGSLDVEAPPYRIDVLEQSDVAEDLAMGLGYEVIGREANALPPATHPGRIHPLEFISRIMRKLLVGYGFIEIANYMLSSPEEQLGLLNAGDLSLIRLSNPKMDKYSVVRRWLAPGLLATYMANYERRPVARIFEIGDVVLPDESTDTGGKTERHLGILVSHDKATLTDGVAFVNLIMERLGIKPGYEYTVVKGFLPERTVSVKIGGKPAGFIGEVDPVSLYNKGIENPVVIAEINLNMLLEAVTH